MRYKLPRQSNPTTLAELQWAQRPEPAAINVSSDLATLPLIRSEDFRAEFLHGKSFLQKGHLVLNPLRLLQANDLLLI